MRGDKIMSHKRRCTVLLKRVGVLVVLAFTLLMIMPRVATAQGLGSLGGTITDPSGSVVPSANVTATEVGTGLSRTATSNAEGNYLILALRPAQYTLSVSLRGFRQFTQTGITLLADQAATVDVRLEVGPTAQKITIQAATTQVDTTTATIKEVVGQSQIVDLPLNGRNAAALTMLMAGVVSASTGAQQGVQKTFPSSVTISSNGSHGGNEVLYLLDGAVYVDQYTDVNQPFPFPDALQEFSIQTSNFAAQYGASAGGVVNVVTKSGTNSLHGDMFEFNRNAVFNARNFFAAKRDQLKRNQFGGTIGGPVTLPGLYDGRDHTFFFFGYQGTRLRNFQGGLSQYIPTQANLEGNFSAMLNAGNPANPLGKVVQIVNPVTGAPYPGNIIDPATFDPASKAFTKYLPTQSASTNGQVFYSLPVVQNFNEFVTRIDHSFGTQDQLTGRYTYNRLSVGATYSPTNILTYGMGSSILSQNYLLRETHIFRPNLLNNAYFTVARMFSMRGPAAGVPTATDLGVQNIFQWGPPNETAYIGVSGFFSCCGAGYGDFVRTTFDFADDLMWVHGRHSFAFGGAIYQSRNDFSLRYMGDGYFAFASTNAGYNTNYAPAAFLLGVMSTFQQGALNVEQVRDTFPGVYAQDTFRASKRLTLNYGLRYEPYWPWYDIRGRGEKFSVSAYYAGTKSRVYTNAPPGLFFQGDSGVPKRFTSGDFNNFMPRVGFAYDVFGDGKTSLRGGAAIYYNSLMNAIQLNGFVFQTPYSDVVGVSNPVGHFSNPYQGMTNPFPAPTVPGPNALFPLPVGAVTFPDHYIVASMYDWSLALEHQFPAGWFTRAAYVGSHTSHFPESLNINPAVYTPGSSLGTDARRPLQPFGAIFAGANDVNGSYNSLQLTVDKRFSSKLTLLVNYTYSKNLDNEPQSGEGLGLGGGDCCSPVPWNQPGMHQMNYGPYTYDHTHSFAAAYVYAFPRFANANPWLRGGLGNWQFSGILTGQSGAPLTIVAGADRSQTGIGKDRAVQTGAAYGAGACKSAPCVNYLIPSSFQLPATGTYGSTGKGMLRGPNFIGWDMGLFKNFPITERWKLQFRAEFFNVFNRVNLGTPVTSVSSGGFGSITSTNVTTTAGVASGYDPRIGQLALKLLF
jgi:hypothetical protein